MGNSKSHREVSSALKFLVLLSLCLLGEAVAFQYVFIYTNKYLLKLFILI